RIVERELEHRVHREPVFNQPDVAIAAILHDTPGEDVAMGRSRGGFDPEAGNSRYQVCRAGRKVPVDISAIECRDTDARLELGASAGSRTGNDDLLHRERTRRRFARQELLRVGGRRSGSIGRRRQCRSMLLRFRDRLYGHRVRVEENVAEPGSAEQRIECLPPGDRAGVRPGRQSFCGAGETYDLDPDLLRRRLQGAGKRRLRNRCLEGLILLRGYLRGAAGRRDQQAQEKDRRQYLHQMENSTAWFSTTDTNADRIVTVLDFNVGLEFQEGNQRADVMRVEYGGYCAVRQRAVFHDQRGAVVTVELGHDLGQGGTIENESPVRPRYCLLHVEPVVRQSHALYRCDRAHTCFDIQRFFPGANRLRLDNTIHNSHAGGALLAVHGKPGADHLQDHRAGPDDERTLRVADDIEHSLAGNQRHLPGRAVEAY